MSGGIPDTISSRGKPRVYAIELKGRYADLVEADELQIGPAGVAVLMLDDEIVAVYAGGTYRTIAPAPPLAIERSRRPAPLFQPLEGGKRPRLAVVAGDESEGILGDLDAGARLELVVDGRAIMAWGLEDLPADGSDVSIELSRHDMTDAELDAIPET